MLDLTDRWRKLNQGGQGSGNYGHSGRKGEVGGSVKDGGEHSGLEKVWHDVISGDKTKFPIVKEHNLSGDTLVYKVAENGTRYQADFPDSLIDVLQTFYAKGIELKFEEGDMITGQSSGRRVAGTLGRLPVQKIPMIRTEASEQGAIGLSTVVKLTRVDGGETLWEHPSYKSPKDGFKDI